ncbi:ATP-binding protein [Kribbella sp. NPDC049584]|uniref:AlbA family DNA-binding domain-containing protein n=1 Tax=Kribbella sp. NPDC049584 TaxID=3154833 RepID=UPI00341763D7
MASTTLYDLPADDVDYDAVRRFVLEAEAANLLTESLTFEIKEKRHGNNVVEAVAALSNTDGGLVLVGVREDAQGEDRLAGVPRSEHDTLVTQMRDTIPGALPEVIAVAKPDTDRLIVVLRVNADRVLHPVLVKGKALYRIPGASVAADRQRLLDLVARDHSGNAENVSADYALTAPSELPLWPDADGAVATVRVAGGLRLPRRILDRQWLTSSARAAALDALQESSLPDTVWGIAPALRSMSLPTQWHITEARSRTVKLQAPEVDQVLGKPATVLTAGDTPVQASAFIQLAGRNLSALVGLRWLPRGPAVPQMAIENLRSALLAGLLAVSSTCQAVAHALDAEEPTELAPWEAWLQPRQELRVSSVLSTDPFPKDGDQQLHGGYFARSRTLDNSVEHLDALARSWVTVLLLDMGVRDFEPWLDALPLPEWAELEG